MKRPAKGGNILPVEEERSGYKLKKALTELVRLVSLTADHTTQFDRNGGCMIDFRRFNWVPDIKRRLAKEMGPKNLNLPQIVIIKDKQGAVIAHLLAVEISFTRFQEAVKSPFSHIIYSNYQKTDSGQDVS